MRDEGSLDRQRQGARGGGVRTLGRAHEILCYAEMEEQGRVANDDAVFDEDVRAEGAMAKPATKAQLLRTLEREDEVQLARQPGQGGQEGAQNMRAVHEALVPVLQDLPRGDAAHTRNTSRYSCVELPQLLAQHNTQLQQLLEEENQEASCTARLYM
jgi:hypothetical protein